MRLPRDSKHLTTATGFNLTHVRVFLDGKYIDGVHEVDEEGGWVKTATYPNPVGVSNVKYETRHGKIEIRLPGDEGYNATPG